VCYSEINIIVMGVNMDSNELKRCPYCGEEIKSVAIKCKHCKSDLIETKLCEKNSVFETDEQVDYLCPKCKAAIQEGVNLCGNCKAQIVWYEGKPQLTKAYAMQQVGCALSKIGCLLPILIGLIALVVILFSL
jgi:hypothetical protein